jgi:hypothetical protein
MGANSEEIDIVTTEADSAGSMAEEYINVSDALKLVTQFSGSKKEILTFMANVDTAFEVINPIHKDRLYKFVLTKISGEPRTAIAHRNLDSWEELREFLKNTYIEKRTLDFHANQLFRARQGKLENISEWIQRIQTLGSKFREAAMTDCTQGERAGILTLSDRLRNICFIQGLQSDRIQTIVRSRNQDDFDEIAETALEEESAIFSKNERYKGSETHPLQCTNCKKSGHTSSRCYFKNKPGNKAHVSHLKANKPIREIICWNCGERGHTSKDCKRPKKTAVQTRRGADGAGNEGRPSGRSPQMVSTTQ